MFDHQQLRQALIAHCKNHLDEESILFLLDTRDLRAMDLGTLHDHIWKARNATRRVDRLLHSCVSLPCMPPTVESPPL